MSAGTEATSALARTLRDQAIGLSFGDVRFWQTAAFRPGDQAWTLVSVRAHGDSLGLILVPASRDGNAVVLEVEAPAGLVVADQAVRLAQAVAIRFGDLHAAHRGEHYALSRGDHERLWLREGHPALSLTP